MNKRIDRPNLDFIIICMNSAGILALLHLMKEITNVFGFGEYFGLWLLLILIQLPGLVITNTDR